jgi:uncharacterized membrane protein
VAETGAQLFSGGRRLVVTVSTAGGRACVAAFIALNTVWLRFAHHFRDIAWNAHALGNSFFVQAGYSVLWTLLGVAAMLVAHKRQQRMIWQAGAALLG